MERFTISLDDRLAVDFDRLVGRLGYASRSEALRDILRARIEEDRAAAGESEHCVAALTYVYKHHQRQLVERIAGLQHEHHDLVVSAMHMHIDHDNCMETVMLRGHTEEVRRFADALTAIRGVRHGRLHPVSVEPTAPHRHAHGAAHHHLKPRS
ncbi:MAG TPA: nickel-responsive transcriptional regulator NikR [Burkholderiales bacterium]|nr:nickel-responsive transcriptional regulator NikR [Burkholderiales bacterium]